MQTDFFIYLTFIVPVFIFLGFFFLILIIVFKLTGWEKIQSIYQTDKTPTEYFTKWGSVQLNKVSINNFLQIGVFGDAIYFSLPSIFTKFVKPILIPFKSFQFVESNHYFISYEKFHVLDRSNQKIAEIRIPTKYLEKILSRLKDKELDRF